MSAEQTKSEARDDAPTLAEIQTWPATVSVPTAGRAWRLSRSTSYALVASGKFPAEVEDVDGRLRVKTASIIRALS